MSEKFIIDREQLKSLIKAFYNDSYTAFTKYSGKKKKFKNKVMYNFLYEWVKNDIAKKIRRSSPLCAVSSAGT